MPVSAVSVPVGTDLNVASNGCYREFLFPPRPGLLPTGSLALNPGKVYFCETRPDTNVIGCLTI
jgi:hypothetical protein